MKSQLDNHKIKKNKKIVKEWFEKYYTQLLLKGYDQFRVANRVEDAIMDTFYKILRNDTDEDYELISKPFGFIWKTFYWAYLDLYRKGKRVQDRYVPLDEKIYGIVCKDESEYTAVTRELFNLILPKLTKDQQTCILLYLEGYSHEEIGKKLKARHDKVSYAILSAKKYIRANSNNLISTGEQFSFKTNTSAVIGFNTDPRIYKKYSKFEHEILSLYTKEQIENTRIDLEKLQELNNKLIATISAIPTASRVTISIKIDEDYDSFTDEDRDKFVSSLRNEFNLKDEIKVIDIKKGSVIIVLEISERDAKIVLQVSEEDARKLVSILATTNQKIISKSLVEIGLNGVKAKIKKDLGESLEKGLKALEKHIHSTSKKYDDFILIKSNYNHSMILYERNGIDSATFLNQCSRTTSAAIRLISELEESEIKPTI